jgi:hypothetical protein
MPPSHTNTSGWFLLLRRGFAQVKSVARGVEKIVRTYKKVRTMYCDMLGHWDALGALVSPP